jgi:hypothetical protein
MTLEERKDRFVQTCAAQGGHLASYGFSGLNLLCEWKTSDSGKECRNTSDCEGFCAVPGDPMKTDLTKPHGVDDVSYIEYAYPIGTKMSGICSSTRLATKTASLACKWLYIDNGTVQKAPCAAE